MTRVPRPPARPLVDVIVPLYESARTIGRTIESLQAQTLGAWRAWVVNDASTDEGPIIVERAAARDPRVRVLRHGANAGLAAARNTGLDASEPDAAPFVHYLDADDWMEPGALDALLHACESSPHGAACAGYAFFDEAGRALDLACHPPTGGVGLDELLDRNRFASHAHMMRRDALAGARFDASLRRCEDFDLWSRLAAAGGRDARGMRWTASPAIVAGYRLRAGGLSRDFRAMLDTLLGVLSRSFARARAAAPEGVDASPTRESRVKARFTLEMATMAGLASIERGVALLARDEDASDTARAIVSRLGTPSSDLASAAFWGAPFGMGRAPLDAHTSHVDASWASRVHAWWSALVALGLVDSGLLAGARRELERLLVLDRAVADAILDEAERPAPGAAGSRTLVIAGLGRHGRTLAERARARGLRSLAMDDRPLVDARWIAEHLDAPITPISRDVPPHALVVVTPDDDAGLTPRLPSKAIRWREVRSSLATRLALPWRVPPGATPAARAGAGGSPTARGA